MNQSRRWQDGQTISEETSLSLLARAQQGDHVAMEALMGRYLVRLRRWASGRLPGIARSLLETDDLVQDAMLNTLRNLGGFKPRHDGALMAYLREAVANRIRSELRRPALAAAVLVQPDDLPSAGPSPLEAAVGRNALEQYDRALTQLDDDERASIIGRFEMGYSFDALARSMNRPSANAARVATARAVKRLIALMDRDATRG